MAVKRTVPPIQSAAPPPMPGAAPASAPLLPGDDPLAALFGGDSKTKLVSISDEDSIPEEVAAAIASFGLTKHNFKVMLKSVPDGTDPSITGVGGGGAYVRAWTRQVPSLEYIAQQWGPGKYTFGFTWMGMDPDTGKQATQRCEIPFEISDKYSDLYEEAMEKRRMERIERQQREIEKARMRNAINGTLPGAQSGDEKISAKKYLEDLMATNQMLGLSKGGSGIDWEKLTPLLLGLIPPVLNMLTAGKQQSQERFDKIMQMMLAQTAANNSSMLELAKVQNPNPTGRDMMGEMFDMIRGAIDIKEAIAGGKESTVDKVFGMIERVAPMVLAMASMPKATRDAMPTTKAAQAYIQADPNFQEALHDPQKLIELVRRLDEWYGWRQTDDILTVGGIERPGECPRLAEFEQPRDQRVPAQAAQEETVAG